MILLLQLSWGVLKAYTQTWQIEPFSSYCGIGLSVSSLELLARAAKYKHQTFSHKAFLFQQVQLQTVR